MKRNVLTDAVWAVTGSLDLSLKCWTWTGEVFCWSILQRVSAQSSFVLISGKRIVLKLTFNFTFYSSYQTAFLSLFRAVCRKWSGPSCASSIVFVHRVIRVCPLQAALRQSSVWAQFSYKLWILIFKQTQTDSSFYKPNLDSSVGFTNTMGANKLVSRYHNNLCPPSLQNISG